MLYTVLVTVEVSAESQHEAYGFIKHALAQAKKQEGVYVDAEVVEQTHEDEDDDGLGVIVMDRDPRKS